MIDKYVIEMNGENGFDSYRVPGLVTASDGSILMYYEGRITDGDRRTLFLRRSTNDGRSFGPRQVIAEPTGKELLHNPIAIAGRNGMVWLFWCRDYGKLYMKISRDNGATFGDTKDMTYVIDGFREAWPVTLWAVSPGHGITMENGTIVLPVWLSRGENAHLPAAFACIYSNDLGRTWKCSNPVPAENGVGDPTEASIAEKSNGKLLATMRHELPGVRKRAFCTGGPEKWGVAYLNHTLPDPICSGALLRIDGSRMAFVNCANEDLPALQRQAAGEKVRWSMDARKNLTLRMSTDDGASFNRGLLLAVEAGASDLALSRSGNEIYCFHEEGWTGGNCIYNRQLVFQNIPVDYL